MQTSFVRHLRMRRESSGMPNPVELRKLVAWYREFAVRTGNPAIWDMRLRTAEELTVWADCAEVSLPCPRDGVAVCATTKDNTDRESSHYNAKSASIRTSMEFPE
jgi:hypothetical protein